ncbi:hypothetical protein D9M69_409090 [compost metagenome]
MAAVLVVLAAEQGGALVQQRALQGRQPLRQAVDLLVDVRLAQVADASGLERVLVPPAPHLEVGVRLYPPAHVLRQRRLQAQGPAEHVVALLQVGVAEGQPVQGELLEGLARKQSVRDERLRQHVALEVEPGLQVDAGPRGLGQAVQGERRLVPAAVGPTLQVIEDLPPIEHRYRIAEGEGLGAGCRLGQHLPLERSGMVAVLDGTASVSFALAHV